MLFSGVALAERPSNPPGRLCVPLRRTGGHDEVDQNHVDRIATRPRCLVRASLPLPAKLTALIPRPPSRARDFLHPYPVAPRPTAVVTDDRPDRAGSPSWLSCCRTIVVTKRTPADGNLDREHLKGYIEVVPVHFPAG